MKVTYLLQSLVVVVVLSAIAGAAPCDDLRALIDKTYNFKPSTLTSAQIDAKSAELDVVWNMVDRNPKELLPCLRAEMKARSSDTFFRFDASNLISKHDKSAEAKKQMIEIYSQVDLADINLRYYLPPMTQLGHEGFDISKVGETWIRYSKLPTDQARRVGAMSVFGSMEESIATPALARLAAEENSTFNPLVVSLLISQATDESDAAVRKLAKTLPKPLADSLNRDLASRKLIVPRVGTPKETRAGYVKALSNLLEGQPFEWFEHTTKVPDGEKDMVVVLGEADLPLIRKVRRMYASKPSPDMPPWYNILTEIINTIRLKKTAGKSKG